MTSNAMYGGINNFNPDARVRGAKARAPIARPRAQDRHALSDIGIPRGGVVHWCLRTFVALVGTVVLCSSPYGCGGGESGDDCVDKCNKSCEHSPKPGCAYGCAIDNECFS